MVANESPEVVQGRQRLIAADIIDPQEADEDSSVNYDGAIYYEEDDSGLVKEGVSTSVTGLGKKEVEEVQQAVKYYSLSFCMSKPPS